MTADEGESPEQTANEGSRPLRAADGSEKEMSRGAVNVEAKILKNHQRPTDFVDAATHDLHTPLNVIMGMCHVMDRDPEPLTAKQKDAVRRIERNAQALLKSINELLRRMRNGRERQQPRP
jgi:signal transduction histidine kinase